MNVDAVEFDVRLAVQPYRDKLAAFETAIEIRDFLVQEGVQAQIFKLSKSPSTTCALAVYMQRESGHDVRVGVYSMDAVRYSDDDDTESFTDLGVNTDAMASFVGHFDDGRYPELELR